MPAAMTEGPAVIFDSGLGGLSVVREVRRQAPRLPLVYVADDAAFPYGDMDAVSLRRHIVALARRIIEEIRPRAFVVACNTASTLVLEPLRAEHDIPFVGTVPAIKPAAEQTRSGLISILATPATIERDYTKDLIARFASRCHVRLVGAPLLANLAEDYLLGRDVDREVVHGQIAPCFLERGGRRTDIVALACTHYPFLSEIMASVAPWPLKWLDPAPAIARRVCQVVDVEAAGYVEAADDRRREQVILTSGRAVDDPVARLYGEFGFPAKT